MMTDKKEEPFKVVFAPGAFDNFDGTQEELDELVAEIQSMFANKTRAEIEAESVPLTDEEFEELPDEVKMQVLRSHFDNGDDDLEDEFRRKLQ